MSDPSFVDMANPTESELLAWAYSDEMAPMEDFDIIVASPEYLPILLATVADPACPTRRFFLASLYCLIGHSDLADARIADAVEAGSKSNDDWLRTWGRRASIVIADPEARDRGDWCGSSASFRESPAA